MDDELQHETESLVRGSPVEARAEEWRQQEGPAEGEPAPDAHVSVDDIELRSLLAISLRPSAFPGRRDVLLAVAEEERAEDRVIEWLRTLPEDVDFLNVEQVWEALGGEYERRDNPSLMMPEPRPSPPVAQPTPPAAEAPAHVPAEPAPAPAQPREPAPGLLDRLCGIARAGAEIAVGLAIQAVQEIRRRV